LIESNPGAVRGLVERNPLDAVLKPPRLEITQAPPINFQSRINWVQASTQFTFTLTSAVPCAAQQFALNDLTVLSNFAPLYDQFCIYAIKVRLTPMIANSAVSGFELGSSIDFDSATVPTGYGQLQEYGNFTEMSGVAGGCLERFIHPCISQLAYNSSLSGYSPSRSWCDSTSPGVIHYGHKFGYNGTTANLSVIAFCTYVVGFRNNI